MRGVWNKSVLAAAMIGMTFVATAQDRPDSLDRAIRTYSVNPSGRIFWDANLEPQLALEGNTHVTGLIVDCMTPQYLTIMLNPPATLRDMRTQVPPSLMPVAIPHPMNDPAAHEPDFALLRISFP